MDNNPPQQPGMMPPNQQPPMDMMGNPMDDPMMMGGPPGGPQGPPGGPQGSMGGPQGPMGGPPHMNGMMDQNGMMMDGDPMMGGPGGPMGGPMGPPMLDEMGMPIPGTGGMMPGDPGYFENSEYHNRPMGSKSIKNCKKVAGHEVPSAGSSMELDSVSVKKIEDREDEYLKVKQSLLSDLDEDDPACTSSPIETKNHLIHDLSPEVMLPELPESLLLSSQSLSMSLNYHPNHPHTNQAGFRRSKDTLESIFGSTTRTAAEPKVVKNDTAAENESRSSFSLITTTINRSPEATTTSSSLLVEQHESILNSSQLPATVKADHNIHHSRINSSLLNVEEPFPVCLSPELDSLVDPLNPLGRFRSPQGPGLPGSGSSAGALERIYSTIPEVPEEEEGFSPTTGDGVSRAIRRGKSRPQPDTASFSSLYYLFVPPLFLLTDVAQWTFLYKQIMIQSIPFWIVSSFFVTLFMLSKRIIDRKFSIYCLNFA